MFSGNDNNSLPDYVSMKELYIKTLSVILIFTIAVCVFAVEKLEYAIAENREKTQILVNNTKYDNSAIDKTKHLVLIKRLKSAKSNIIIGIPFLCEHIKYRSEVMSEMVMFRNSNQILCYSPERELCVFYKYKKRFADLQLSLEACNRIATQKVYSIFSKYGSSKITHVQILSINSKIVRYKCYTNITGTSPVYISLARDTGSVVFFCIIY